MSAFPDPPPPTTTPALQAMRTATPAEYEKRTAESGKATADYNRDYALYDAEAVAAVDKFRADRNLNYQGNPPGLADARLFEALRAAYLDKKKTK
jgi:hypothetical protein